MPKLVFSPEFFVFRKSKNQEQTTQNQKGFAPIVVIVLLLVGLGLGLYLVNQKTNFFSKASTAVPVVAQTSFALEPQGQLVVGTALPVKVQVHSDIDAANLFNAKIKFPTENLEVLSIDTTGSFVTQWAEQFYDNTTGEISLVGGVAAPGLTTSANSSGSTMATINFKAKKAGLVTMTIADASEIFRNSDSVNIYAITGYKNTFDIASSLATPTPTPAALAKVTVSPTTIDTKGTITVTWSGLANPTLGDYVNILASNSYGVAHSFWIQNNCTWFTPSTGTPKSSGSCTIDLSKEAFGTEFANPFRAVLANNSGIITESNTFTITGLPTPPSPTPIPSPTAAAVAGDGNNDGKVTLVDMSVLLKNYGSKLGYPGGLDINRDGVINTFDFAGLKQILVNLKILRG